VIRVLAQPVALLVDLPLLPRFESWHSGLLPYRVLLAAQLLIVLWLARTAWVFGTGAVAPRTAIGVTMVALGGVYLAVMAARLVLGTTILSHQRWFASQLPTAFHMVLATYFLLYGHFHLRYGSNASRRPEASV
jgi:hypothetical protein